MTDDAFRDLALVFDGAIEGAHMGHPDFRANGRIFASLHADAATGMVVLTPEQQSATMRAHPRTFAPASGAWGRQGCTTVRLEGASTAAVRGALLLAWQGAMAKPRKRAAPKKAATKKAPRAKAATKNAAAKR